MNREEIHRYTDLLAPDPVLRAQMEVLNRLSEEEVEERVGEKVSELLPEAAKEEAKERLLEIADAVDTLQEHVLSALRRVSYEELPDIVEGLFDRFHSVQNLRGD